MKRKALTFAVLLASAATLFAQEGREVLNLTSAVRGANAGDFITLPSGGKYVLTKEEIEIANGTFDFGDLSGVAGETRDDGTVVKTISQAHTAFVFPDGQSAHLLKTIGSFTEYMQQYIERNYYLGYWIDVAGNTHEAMPNGSATFYVFRATVQFYTISDGFNSAEVAEVTAFNYKGQNFVMRYFSTDGGWEWGYVNGTFSPVGETHEIEFDVE